MADVLEKKKRTREGHRGSTTRLITRVNAALTSTSIDEDKLTQLKFSINDKLQVLKLLNDKIAEAITDEDQLAREIESADEAKEDIYLALTKIDRACARKCLPVRPQ